MRPAGLTSRGPRLCSQGPAARPPHLRVPPRGQVSAPTLCRALAVRPPRLQSSGLRPDQRVGHPARSPASQPGRRGCSSGASPQERAERPGHVPTFTGGQAEPHRAARVRCASSHAAPHGPSHAGDRTERPCGPAGPSSHCCPPRLLPAHTPTSGSAPLPGTSRGGSYPPPPPGLTTPWRHVALAFRSQQSPSAPSSGPRSPGHSRPPGVTLGTDSSTPSLSLPLSGGRPRGQGCPVPRRVGTQVPALPSWARVGRAT